MIVRRGGKILSNRCCQGGGEWEKGCSNVRSGEMTAALSALEGLLLGMAAKMALQVLGSPERALADRALCLAANRRALFNFTTIVGTARSSCCFSFLRV